MKRVGVLTLGLALAAASSANAQALSMQMGNGWSFGLSGNVNAFYVYSNLRSCSTTGGSTTCDKSGQQSGIGTGLLPANLNFDIKGKEGNTDLGVHFGFFPQVSSGGNTGSYFGSDAAGAQIDMRQVYLTVGGTWGQVLMGKQLGLFQRGNIVNDMTIYGSGPNAIGNYGATSGFRGTALGRIGYGYLYTDFRGQLTYSTAAGKPYTFAVGIFEPATFGEYSVHSLPRLETEFTYDKKFSGDKNSFGFFASGMLQSSKNDIGSAGDSETALGGAGGIKLGFSGLTLVGSGFYAKGQGSIFMGSVNSNGTDASDDLGNLRTSYGWYGQASFTPTGSKWTIAGSYGGNWLQQTDADEAGTGGLDDDGFKSRTAIVGAVTYQVTKSYRLVFEYTNFKDKAQNGDKIGDGNQGAVGMMLFF